MNFVAEQVKTSIGVFEIMLILLGTVFVISIISTIVYLGVIRKRNNAKPINHNIPATNISRPMEKTFKRCPACQSTFTDESLNYCLSDGTLLEGANNASDEVETVLLRTKTKG